MPATKNKNWVDFEALKRNVSFLTILEHYGLVGHFKQKGNKLTGKCPIHKGDSSTSCHIDLEKGAYRCFTRCKSMGLRGGGNILDFVADMEKFGLGQEGIKRAAKLIMEFTGTGQGTVPLPAGTPRPAPHKPEPPPENKPLAFSLHLKTDHPYFKERGITPETVRLFGLGLAEKGMMTGRIAIPIYDHRGSLVAYAGRALDAKSAEEGGKYKLPANFHKMQVLYNYHRAKDFPTLILVEGFFDCFKVYQAGFLNVCALMGTAMSDFHAGLILKTFTQVVLMLDNDPAGRRGTGDILNRLYDKIFVRVVRLEGFNGASQPDQLSERELAAALAFLKA
ncbi:MAG: toprim domain-containing protein [Veillonellaceae bacterium]|nr:toprim domain-containing protein [Veillonellaceae bacterium]